MEERITSQLLDEAARTVEMIWMRALHDLGGMHPAVWALTKAGMKMKEAAEALKVSEDQEAQKAMQDKFTE